MPIPSTPSIMPNVLGYAADTVQIPETTPTGQGIPSFRDLFPFITQVEPEAGGVMVERAWMNALFNLLGQHAFFQQSGSVYPWQGVKGDFPGLNYLTGAHVLGADGKEYIANMPNGPDFGVGPVDPVTDTGSYWRLAARRIISTLTIYVRTTGDDANDGLTQQTAKRTLVGAVAGLSAYELASATVTIDVGAGRFSGVSISRSTATAASINFQGAGIEQTVITSTIQIENSRVRFYTMAFDISAGFIAIEAIMAGVADVYSCKFNGLAIGAIGVNVHSGGIVGIRGTTTVSGSYVRVLSSFSPGSSIILEGVINASGSIGNYNSLDGAFAFASECASIVVQSGGVATIAGTMTGGYRYLVDLNAIIRTGASGPNFFPGSTAGAAANGGVYV